MRKILLNTNGTLSANGTGFEWFLNFGHLKGATRQAAQR